MRVGVARAVLGLVLVSWFVASCSTPEPPPEPEANPGGAPSSADEPTAGGVSSVPGAPGGPEKAPPVSNPLDASSFMSRPCSVLTEAQLQSFGIASGGEPGNTGGPNCSWNNPEQGFRIGFGFTTDNPNGLNDVYLAHATQPPGYFGYFEPTTVEGYPAVFNDAVDSRPSGTCSLGVAISDKSMFNTGQVSGDGAKQSCTVAKQVAAAVISTLKSGS